MDGLKLIIVKFVDRRKISTHSCCFCSIMKNLSNISPMIKVCHNSLKDEKWMDYYCSYDYESWQPPEQRVSWIVKQIKNAENASILDVGCGAYPVTSKIKAKEKIGMDISLKAAESVLTNFNEVYIVDLLHLDKDEVSQLKERFDYIVLAETLEHFDDPYTILNNLKYFLKDNGRIIITYPNHFSLSMYIDWLKNFGKYVRYKDFMEGHFTFFNLHQLKFVFCSLGFGIESFDFRPCDIIPETFPKEKNKIWKLISSISPCYFGHQFFFHLKKVDEPLCFPARFRVVIKNGVRVIVHDQSANA